MEKKTTCLKHKLTSGIDQKGATTINYKSDLYI
jgi:hypothetical protein